MSQCRTDRDIRLSKYLLIFILSGCLSGFSTRAFSQGDTTARRERLQPPPHPKPPSLKAVINKINIFKKHKDDPAPVTPTETAKQPDPIPPLVPPPAPTPQPDAVKPKTTAKHTTTKKKTQKTTTPVPDKKKTKTNKPLQPLV
jgi:hypothetical protein